MVLTHKDDIGSRNKRSRGNDCGGSGDSDKEAGASVPAAVAVADAAVADAAAATVAAAAVPESNQTSPQ